MNKTLITCTLKAEDHRVLFHSAGKKQHAPVFFITFDKFLSQRTIYTTNNINK